CLHSPRTPTRLVPLEHLLRRVCLAPFRLRFALDPGPTARSYYGSRAVALSTNLGGPVAQYPIINAVPFLLQSRLHAHHQSLVGLFPRTCRPRLVDRRPTPVVSDLPRLRDAILSRNCPPDPAQPRSKSEAALTAKEMLLPREDL